MNPENLTSYHTHTTLSDGTASFREMAEAAAQAGLSEYGFSDHYVPAPPSVTIPLNWAMPADCLNAYIDQVAETATAVPIPIRLGLEVDYFPETCSSLPGRLDNLPFDYLIGSVHIVGNFPIDCSADWWTALSQDEVNEMYVRYWKRVREMAATGLFDIAGHLDLPKKFGILPTVDLRREIDEALQAIAGTDMAIELNTSGWDKPCAEPYPATAVLERALALGIPILISADAHAPGEVARHYQAACDRLDSLGIKETVRYLKRQRFPVPWTEPGVTEDTETV